MQIKETPEDFVVEEVIKLNIKPNGEYSYFLLEKITLDKNEIDFVIESKGSVIPLEIKSELNKAKFTPSFISFIEKYKPKKSFMFSEKLFAEKNKTKFRPIFSVGNEI